MINVSVIIVNYNVRHFLSKCLESILRINQGEEFSIEIIVVDNNSTDDSFPFLENRYGEKVKFVRNKNNVGFGKACNQGAAQATGKYLLFLNPDTIVPKDTIYDCWEYLESPKQERVVALGVKIVDGAGNFLPESKRAFPTIWNSFCKLTGISKIVPNTQLFGGYNLQHLSPDQDHDIDVLCGAFMMIKKESFDFVNGFDEAFFMYGEDIDLCYRLKSSGGLIRYKSDNHIIHFKGESSKNKDRKYYRRFYNAMSIYAQKHYSYFVGFILRSAIFISAILALSLHYLKKTQSELLDFAGLYLLFQSIKFIWAKLKFQDLGYYEYPKLYLLSLAIIILMIFSLFLAGYYRKSASFRNLLTGVLSGGLFIFAFYGLLPIEWRFSRAVLLLFVPSSVIILLFLSGLKNYFRKGKFSLLNYQKQRLVFAGDSNLYNKIRNLVIRANESLILVGRISLNSQDGENNVLGHIGQLPHLIDQYDLDEIVFGLSDEKFDMVFPLLNKYGRRIRFKVLGRDGLSLVGSNNPANAGDLYLFEINYNITDNSSQFVKWVFDKSIAITICLGFPLFIFTKRYLLKEALSVIVAGNTWISYDDADPNLEVLPKLPKGIIPITIKDNRKVQINNIHLRNLQYAKNYSVFTDMEIFIFHFIKNKTDYFEN